jgi:hypothetical protein
MKERDREEERHHVYEVQASFVEIQGVQEGSGDTDSDPENDSEEDGSGSSELNADLEERFSSRFTHEGSFAYL